MAGSMVNQTFYLLSIIYSENTEWADSCHVVKNHRLWSQRRLDLQPYFQVWPWINQSTWTRVSHYAKWGLRYLFLWLELEIILSTYLAQSKCLININYALRNKKSIAYSLLSLLAFDRTCCLLHLPKRSKHESPNMLTDITGVCVAPISENVEWHHGNILELWGPWEKVSHWIRLAKPGQATMK